MPHSPANDQLLLYMSLFKGRDDVYARRWERNGKGGYAPAYEFDFEEYNRFKVLGGVFKDFPSKRYAPLTPEVHLKHILGNEIIGLYSLLPDNTSWFLSFDFDEQDWQADASALLRQCDASGLSAYLERSRSGNGGHVWIFFDEPYPAVKSRAIARNLLQQAGLITKSSTASFDRIFPNQDFLSGKGLSNLIALPLQGAALAAGNTAFLDPATFKAIPDQWEFLQQIRRVTTITLESLRSVGNGTQSEPAMKSAAPVDREGFLVTLDRKVTVCRDGLPARAVEFLRKELRVSNPDFFIRKATGRTTGGIQSFASSLEEEGEELLFPRGFIGPFLRYCRQHQLNYTFNDLRQPLPELDVNLTAELRSYQRHALDATSRKDFGVIVLPPGTGKTLIGLSIVATKKQPALIIVHRRQLLEQWTERITSFLSISRHKIGFIKNGQHTIGDQVTVAMIQSLDALKSLSEIERCFGLILVDECHHAAAPVYRQVLQQLHTKFLYGLTASPIRKNKDEQLVFQQLGELIYELPAIMIPGRKNLVLNIRDTDLQTPFDTTTDDFELLSGILIHDSDRNALIVNDVRTELERCRSVVIVTERIAHMKILERYLKPEFELVVISGEESTDARRSKFRRLSEGSFQILLTTGQFFGEGMDLDMLDCLFLVYPFSFEGKLVQYIGRVQRGDLAPVIYDYRDMHIPILEAMFRKRNAYYARLKQGGQIQLQQELLLRFEGDRFYIGANANALPVAVLDLGMDVERFAAGVCWKIRLLKYDESTGAAFAEILDYEAALPESGQLTLSYLSITQLRFRTLDTVGLLRSVVLKRGRSEVQAAGSEEYLLFEKTIKVPFKKLRFENGQITIPYRFAPLKTDITLEIHNPVIRPEFGAVSDYFQKALRLSSVSVNVIVRYSKQPWKIFASAASSADIASIDAELIESVRFEFVKARFLKARPAGEEQVMSTFDELQELHPETSALLDDASALLDQVLNIETARHYLQLKYLAAKHEASVLKLRFVLQPFSFLFLLSGERQYHIVWETLDTDEATYIWHVDKSRPALRLALDEIEIALKKMRTSGRQEYLKKEVSNFSRIMHDYSDLKRGFVLWQGILEERLL